MKKGFTMIELIFVIVILGILASVAIPRLAATREDAEISAAVANIRTLVSDASAYYTVKGEFDANAKWNEITNVPLNPKNPNNAVAVGNAVGNDATAHLKVGGNDCIGVKLVERVNPNIPAHIVFSKNTTNNNGVCAQVLASNPLKPYFDSTVNSVPSRMAIGSSTDIYTAAATAAATQKPAAAKPKPTPKPNKK